MNPVGVLVCAGGSGFGDARLPPGTFEMAWDHQESLCGTIRTVM
jgi:hypothetical protein